MFRVSVLHPVCILFVQALKRIFCCGCLYKCLSIGGACWCICPYLICIWNTQVPSTFLLVFLRHGLSKAWDLSRRAGWLATRSHDLSVSDLLALEIKSYSTTTRFVNVVVLNMGSHEQTQMLIRYKLTEQALSPTLKDYFCKESRNYSFLYLNCFLKTKNCRY